MLKKYEKLKSQYPEYISLEQLCKICNISNKTARYLIEHQILLVVETDEKKLRYKISIENVITYLRRREQWRASIPPKAVSARQRKPSVSFYEVIQPMEKDIVHRYFEHICKKRDDVLTASEVAEITGIHKKTLLKLLKDGVIKSIITLYQYLIPKPYLLEFVVSTYYIKKKTNTKAFTTIVKGFEVWKESL